ncbi:MAG: winged helix-turn-helix transcriptional regulator [Candidatus Gastranaerophilales bacterium]|nr:winged helix-turn-helix transcriptional regulator [Candidatus Gastranaerophilales bacterium]
MNYQIGNKLKQLNSMLSEVDNIYQSLLKANNVSESEYIVMFAINELGEGCSQKDISENGYASKKTINSTIKKFEKDGHIELRPAKYPSMQIFLTEKGKKFMEESIIPILRLESNVLDDVPEDEFEALAQCYRKHLSAFRSHVEKFIKGRN